MKKKILNKLIKIITFWSFVLILLFFTLASLHDIILGQEPDLFLEYLIIAIIFPIFGYMLGNLWLFLAKITKMKILRLVKHGGFHFHHSLLAVVMLFASFFLPIAYLKIAVGGLGAGIFFHHLITEGLIFITKD